MILHACQKNEYGRCVPPEETVARLEAVLQPRYAYRLLEEQVADHLHWTAMFLDGDDSFRAMGKGISAVQSKAGALAEGAEWLGTLPVERLPGYTAAHQEDVTNPIPIEDLVAHVATATSPVIEQIKRLDTAKHWVDGYSLIHGNTVSVPIEYVRQIGGPNGRASGNQIEEAIVHGLLEIFERRAHITVLRNRLVMPTIDATTIDHPVILAQMRALQNRDIEITLKDLSFEGNLPCVGAYFADPHVSADHQFHHFFKVGSSFDREEALVRIFTEYTQGRRADEFGDGVEVDPIDFRHLPTQPQDTDSFLSAFMFGMVPFRNADFLLEGAEIRFDPGIRYHDGIHDIEAGLQICRTLGKDCVAVDLTHPEFGFPVVQMVVPGYADILPYHPHASPVLFREWTRDDVFRTCRTVKR